ncbi:PhzF family phenazine biosynthesis protein [Actinomadura montaniterrae]|uniref:PhzF family phenazine biosynthesis protein n=1 Tax=Actinomadura montaniterrae TaxID=1803903 RepID=A0A6L3W9J2_9ACTN|nr:PhzF family phenazine biosynthesis protein [Actinomadura montaniterrae]
MRATAAEVNQPTTAFVWREGDAGGIRWFTPVRELPLCGHATGWTSRRCPWPRARPRRRCSKRSDSPPPPDSPRTTTITSSRSAPPRSRWRRSGRTSRGSSAWKPYRRRHAEGGFRFGSEAGASTSAAMPSPPARAP